jgi:hypothetical protein
MNHFERFSIITIHYLSNVPVDYSSDVMAYPAAASDSIFDVATAISFYCIYTQTTYDMANDSTTSYLNCSTCISY